MLQPLQLQDVSLRYPDEIAELRVFLTRSGLPMETSGALAAVAARLPRDRAFHRDLTSYIWVLIEQHDRKITYSDLLGVLTIAAAGAAYAADSNEDDAHDLLRFLMEARCSLYAASGRAGKPAAPSAAEAPAIAPTVVIAVPPPEPVQSRVSQSPRAIAQAPVRFSAANPASLPGAPTRRFAEASHSPHARFAEADLPSRALPSLTESRRNRAVWLALVACFFAALSGGLWLYHRTQAPAQDTAAGPDLSKAAPADTSLSPDGTQPGVRRSSAPEIAAGRVPPLRTTPPSSKSDPANLSSRATSSLAPYAEPASTTRKGSIRTANRAEPAATLSAPRTGLPASASATANPAVPPSTTSARTPASSAAPLVVRSASAARFTQAPLPSATLSKRLGTPTLPAYASAPGADNPSDLTGHPRLRRRRPATVTRDDGTLLAETGPEVRPESSPANPFLTRGANHAGAANPSSPGTVRPASVGIMAANVLYTPVPAYPAAASAARVQGEVKVQAHIDRDGNVDSARVVSGPPLLRDAALDAVERWRFRPFLSSGKPVSTNTLAIMDFELP